MAINKDEPIEKEIPMEDKDEPIEDTSNVVEKKSAFSKEELSIIKEELKTQLFAEFKDEQKRKIDEETIRRKEEKKAHESYVATMHDSDEPWVEIIAWVRTDNGVKTELDYNEAFVSYLKTEGIQGTDEEEIVQRWITLLLHDIAGQMEEKNSESGEFE